MVHHVIIRGQGDLVPRTTASRSPWVQAYRS